MFYKDPKVDKVIEPCDLDRMETDNNSGEFYNGDESDPDPIMLPNLSSATLTSEKSPSNGVFIQDKSPLPDKENHPEVYHQALHCLAWKKIKMPTNTKVIKGKGNNKITWKVIVSCSLDDISVKNMGFANIKPDRKIT